MAGMTVIVRTISRLLFPFIILFGIYIVLHGHLTPGGGFPGGVIIASSFVMLVIAYGIEMAKEKFGLVRAEIFESVGGLSIILIGICGVLFGVYFLQNAPVFPLGQVGALFSAGNLPLLYIAVGLKVAAGVTLIFYAVTKMLEVEKEKSG